jgi:hypothetical protein
MTFELQPFNRNVSDEMLLNDLIAAHSTLQSIESRLTFRTYKTVGKYSPSTITARFGTWNHAMQRAGLRLNDEKYVSVDSLFDNLRIVWIAKGRQPVYRDMNAPPSEYAGSTYNARFGGWRKALERFVNAFSGEQEAALLRSVVQTAVSEPPRKLRGPSLSLRFLVLKRDNFRCVACGQSPATAAGLVLEVDHIMAWSRGGETVLQNLQTLCFDCNRGKSDT